MNNDQARDALIYLRASFPNAPELDRAQIVVWMETLLPLEEEPTRRAIVGLRETQTYLPSHAELLERVREEIDRQNRQLRERMTGVPRSETTACSTCRGTFFAEVSEEYVRRMVALHDGHNEGAIRNSVMPCPRCRPVEFLRWEDGHWMPDHDRKACQECSDTAHGRGAKVREELQQRAAAHPPHESRQEVF